MIARGEFLAAAASAPSLLKSARRRTNVIFFLTGDHGAWALNCYGCPDLHTPNLDRLAAGGHHGVQDWLQTDDSAGPSSKAFLEGWHMGQHDKAQAGFSYWCTVPGGGGTFRDPEFVVNGKRERIWFSPACMSTRQASMFGESSRSAT